MAGIIRAFRFAKYNFSLSKVANFILFHDCVVVLAGEQVSQGENTIEYRSYTKYVALQRVSPSKGRLRSHVSRSTADVGLTVSALGRLREIKRETKVCNSDVEVALRSGM